MALSAAALDMLRDMQNMRCDTCARPATKFEITGLGSSAGSVYIEGAWCDRHRPADPPHGGKFFALNPGGRA